MAGQPPISFGDKVRIRSTPETEATGMAGLVGAVHGETTPSVTGVEVVGRPLEDHAVHVFVEALDRGAWFVPELLEFIDHDPGATITLDGVGKRWVREPSGRWTESRRWLPPREWYPWLRGVVRRLLR